jgi:hypothetical protein
MESAKDFLLKACEMADGVVLADSPASRDRMIAGLVGYLSGLRDGYLVMDEMFKDISEAAIDE